MSFNDIKSGRGRPTTPAFILFWMAVRNMHWSCEPYRSRVPLEKELAIHSSVLAWRIPGTGEPGGLPLMRSHRVGHDWSGLAAAAGCPSFLSSSLLCCRLGLGPQVDSYWDRKHSVLCCFSSLIASIETSVQFSHSVVSNSLWPHGLQHARPPCPSPTPRACSNSCPSSRWYYPTISSSVIPFSSRLQSFPASGSFPMSQFFALGGQSIGSFSFSISPSNEHPGLISFRMDWLDLLAVQGTLKSLLQQHSSKASLRPQWS